MDSQNIASASSRRSVSRGLRIAIASVTFIGASLLVLAFLSVSSLGRPTLEISVVSTEPGFSQVFVAQTENNFSEEASVWAPVSKKNEVLKFPLRPWRGTVGNYMRWDPLDRPAEMEIQSITLRSALVREDVQLSNLRPSMGTSEVLPDGNVAYVELQSNDPQILLQADVSNFFQKSFQRSLALSLGIGVITAIATYLYTGRRRRHVADRIEVPRRLSGETLPDGVLRIPAWASASFAIIATLGVGLLIFGSRRIGVSWDEPTHESSLGELFRSGLYAPRWSFTDGVPSEVAATVYAPFADLLGHALGAVTGTHAWFTESYLAASYAYRHLAVALISLAGIAAASLIARTLMRSWTWAVLAVAAAMSVPLFVGHSMFNMKDAPVAAGFTIFSFGLVHLITHGLNLRHAVLAAVAVAVGLVVAVGSRPGIWIALFLTAGVSLVLLFMSVARSVGVRQALHLLLKQMLTLLAASAVAYLALWLVYPTAFDNAITLLVDSLATSQAFPWSGQTLTAGTQMPAQPPWNYIPLWLGAQLPVLIAVSALVGVVVTSYHYVTAVARRQSVSLVTIGAIPLALQTVAVPVGAVLLGSTLYGGLRQLLFIFPAVACLAVIGLYLSVASLERRQRTHLVSVVWVLAVVGLTVPLISQIRLFPYNFAHFNAVASTSDIDRYWDVDEWWLSGRELVEDKQFPARTICVDSQSRPITDCSRMGMITPFLSDFGNSEVMLAEDQYVALSRFAKDLGDDRCTPFREVTRGLFFQEILLSHADVCTVSLAPYPEGGLNFLGLTNDDPVVLWGWNPYLLWGWGQPDADGVWMVEPEASVGFTASLSLEESATGVEITGSGSTFGDEGGSLRVYVNGVDAGTIPLPGEGQSQSSRVVVPEGALAELIEGRVVIRLHAEGVDPLALEAAIDTGASGLLRIERLVLQ